MARLSYTERYKGSPITATRAARDSTLSRWPLEGAARSIGPREPYSYVVIDQKSDFIALDFDWIANATDKQLWSLATTIPNFPSPDGLDPRFRRSALYKIICPVSLQS